MKKLVAAICVVILALASVTAHATVTPSQSTPVGLEHDPEGIVARGTTDHAGNVTYSKLKAGTYTVVVTDTSSLKAPVSLSITAGKVHFVSAPIAPGKRGATAFASDKTGRKLSFTVDKDGGSITVNVFSTEVATKPTGSTR